MEIDWDTLGVAAIVLATGALGVVTIKTAAEQIINSAAMAVLPLIVITPELLDISPENPGLLPTGI